MQIPLRVDDGSSATSVVPVSKFSRSRHTDQQITSWDINALLDVCPSSALTKGLADARMDAASFKVSTASWVRGP